MEVVKKEFKSERLGDYTIELQELTKRDFTGDVIVTDPCYFVGDEIWQNLVDMWFTGDESTVFYNHGLAVITVKGKRCEFLYTKTAYGDGDYPLLYNSGILDGRSSVGVDAGMISVVLLEDAEHLRMGKNPQEEFKRSYYPKLRGFDGAVKVKGCNFAGHVSVITDAIDDYDID